VSFGGSPVLIQYRLPTVGTSTSRPQPGCAGVRSTFLRQPGLDATNWRAELAIRFGVILKLVDQHGLLRG
jgi:hypothetical protein